MPRNPTTGIFTRVSNSFSNPIQGTVIDPTDASALFDDYDDGLSPPPQGLIATSVAVATYQVLSTDVLIEVNYAGSVTITLDDPDDRSLYGLIIKDISGAASANNISIVGGVDGVDPLVISSDYGGYNLYPSSGTYRFMP